MESSVDELKELKISKPNFSVVELLSAYVKRPSFSIIVDKPSTFQAGATLLQLQVGEGHKNPADGSASIDYHQDAVDGADKKKKRNKKKEYDYCPLKASTAENVKILARVPEVIASVNVLNLLKFIFDHFSDADRFLDYVAVLTSTKKFNGYQHVAFMRKLLVILMDFMVKPDIDLTVNISTRIIANPSDVIICIENQDHSLSVLSMRVKVNIVDLLTGLLSLKTSFYKCFIVEDQSS